MKVMGLHVPKFAICHTLRNISTVIGWRLDAPNDVYDLLPLNWLQDIWSIQNMKYISVVPRWFQP
jgi:hypothetical protein